MCETTTAAKYYTKTVVENIFFLCSLTYLSVCSEFLCFFSCFVLHKMEKRLKVYKKYNRRSRRVITIRIVNVNLSVVEMLYHTIRAGFRLQWEEAVSIYRGVITEMSVI